MILFLFLDGVGLGEAVASVNPFAAARTPFLAELLGGALTSERSPIATSSKVFRPIDARLGFPGLPQSATGQTALLTGKNGAAMMDGHYGPYPGPTLKKVLDEGTLFSEVVAAGGRAGLANAFPPGYFAAVEGGKRRVNVPVYAAQAAGLPLLTLEDYAVGRALSADLSGAYAHELDSNLPLYSFEEAGAKLVHIARNADFTFFDFWLSDSAGHRWSFEASVELVEQLDAFLSGLVPALGDVTLLLTSDHGNLEDKRTKSHTKNPVPLLVLGPAAPAFAEVQDVLGVAPAVRKVLSLEPSPPK